MLDHAPKLRWVQATSAGIGSFVVATGLEHTEIAFTTAAGIHGRPLAEFVAWACLAAAKDYPLARAQQRQNTWKRFHSGEVFGSTVLLIGVGGVGRSVAQLMRALGAHLIGIKRDANRAQLADLHVDELHPLAELDRLLPEADHVVLACPLTPETERLFDRERFSRLAPGTTLVNIGRGGLVVPDALHWALDTGRVGTAILDVTDPEPLPADDPLWRHERVIIFPHSASTSLHENDRLVALFIDNLHRYAEGRPLRNLYQRELRY
jgi:glyoxylate/hydroxypyruvate reductase